MVHLVDPIGALLPAVLTLGLVFTGRAGSTLRTATQGWLAALAFTLTLVTARMVITPETVALYSVPGATVLVLYLAWRGHYITPALAFALTYASMLPVDFLVAKHVLGGEFTPEGIGGGGWLDALLVVPVLTALSVAYANWRIARQGAGQLWPRRSRRRPTGDRLPPGLE